ncbi:MAG: hypothetical protein ACRELY_18670 [Polyangiaceae bacterium]
MNVLPRISRLRRIAAAGLLAGCVAVCGACSSSSSGSCSGANTPSSTSKPGEAGTAGTLASFTPPADPGKSGILFAASGEVLALTGYPFPPVNDGDPAFVDGWDVKFTRLLVTVDKITVSNNPDLSPGDQSQFGSIVGEVDGPWAIDLSHSDPSYLPGKGGAGEEAAPIAALTNQNRNCNAPFATDGTRYAFGFDIIPATAKTSDGRATMNVNIDAAGQADYQTMITNQCAILYVGTATFKGGTITGHTDCNSDAEYADWPNVVNFSLCYKSPTTYQNCQNPDNDPAAPISPDEEHERGIALRTDGSVIGQVTIHTDHPFWDSVLHDSPAHFDQFAARVAGQPSPASVTLETTQGVDYTAYTDVHGNKLNWRYCIDPPTDVHPELDGPMAFDPQNIPHASGNDASSGLRDYYDFTTYNQSTQGHLNSDGLCFVKRNYPSPQ